MTPVRPLTPEERRAAIAARRADSRTNNRAEKGEEKTAGAKVQRAAPRAARGAARVASAENAAPEVVRRPRRDAAERPAPSRVAVREMKPHHQARPKLSPAVKGKVADLYHISCELCALLEEENAALEVHRHDHVATLVEQKRKLTRLYTEQMNGMEKDPGQLKALPEADRSAFAVVARQMDELSARNGRLLKAGMKASQKLLEAVVDAVKDKNREKSPHYSGEGELDLGNDNRNKAVGCYKSL